MKFSSQKFYSLLLSSCIDMVIAVIMTLSDTLVAGYFLGENAVSAVGVITPVFSFTISVSVLFSSGLSVCYNYEMGKFNKEKAHKFFGLGVILASFIGIVMFAAAFFGNEFYIQSINPAGEVRALAKEYYTFYPFILLIYPIYTVLCEMVYGDGDEKSFTVSSLLYVGTNLIASILLCKSVGLRGISLGSFIGLGIAILALLPHFFKKSSSLRFKWYISLKDTFSMMKYGSNDAVQFLCLSLLQLVFTRFVIVRFGSELLAVVSVVVGVIDLTVMFDGIGQAMNPICSVYLGEGNSIGVRSVMQTAKKAAIIMGALFSVLILVFAPFIPGIFGIDNPDLIAKSIVGVRIVGATLAFASLKYLFATYYCLIDKVWLSVAMTAISDTIAPILIGMPLAYAIGMPGIWVGLAIAPIAALLLPYFLSKSKQNGKTDMLMLTQRSGQEIVSLDIELSKENIIRLRENVEKVLSERGVCQKTVLRVMLIIEETFTLIMEKNSPKKVYAECTVIIDDRVHLILRDSGVIFDITDSDMSVTSLQVYVLSGLMAHQRSKKNLTTIAANRNEFCFEKTSADEE